MEKWFCVATEGATTDGRNIARAWIEQMSKNFNRKVYGARIWLEHLRGLFSDGPFAALGDVIAVKCEECKEGDLKGKMQLFVQLEATDALKAMNAKKQKIYTSIEVDTNFADKGEAYLVGLAVTDSPASLGTEMLQFSAKQGQNSPLQSRKQRPENLFTEAVEIDLAGLFEEKKDDKPGLLDGVKELFARFKDKGDKVFEAFTADLKGTLELLSTKIIALEKAGTDFAALKKAHEDLQERFTALSKQLDITPDTPERKSATGNDLTFTKTDC